MEQAVPIDTLTGLGGTAAIVGLFLWYLQKRDQLLQEVVEGLRESMNLMGDKIEKLADAITRLDRRIHHVEKLQKQQTKIDEEILKSSNNHKEQ